MFDKKTNIAAQEAIGEAATTSTLAFDDRVAVGSVDHNPAPARAQVQASVLPQDVSAVAHSPPRPAHLGRAPDRYR